MPPCARATARLPTSDHSRCHDMCMVQSAGRGNVSEQQQARLPTPDNTPSNSASGSEAASRTGPSATDVEVTPTLTEITNGLSTGAESGAGPGSGGQGSAATQPQLAAPRRSTQTPVWAWPVAATVVVAVSGQFLGAVVAAVIVAVLLVAAIAKLLSLRPDRPRGWATAISLIVGVACGGAIYLGQERLDGLAMGRPSATPTPAHEPTATAGLPRPISSADLVAFDLRSLELRGADLRGAILTGKRLSGQNLKGANLSGADFSGSDLSGARLYGADLRGAILRDACLQDANFTGANLAGADFTGADIRGATIRSPTDALPIVWPPTPSDKVRCNG